MIALNQPTRARVNKSSDVSLNKKNQLGFSKKIELDLNLKEGYYKQTLDENCNIILERVNSTDISIYYHLHKSDKNSKTYQMTMTLMSDIRRFFDDGHIHFKLISVSPTVIKLIKIL